jgi:hypothetical protein
MPEHEYYLKTKWKWFYAGLGVLTILLVAALVYSDIHGSISLFNMLASLICFSIFTNVLIYRPVFKPQVILTDNEITSLRFRVPTSLGMPWLSYSNINYVIEGKLFGVGYRDYYGSPTNFLRIYKNIENAQECYDIIASRMKEHQA